MGGFDFMEWLGIDLSLKVLLCLEDPSDIIRVSAVSSQWRQFVINNGICKKLCMKIFPEMSTVITDGAIEVESMIEPADDVPSNNECNKERTPPLIKEHRVYAILARGLDPCVRNDCISEAIRASSTDNYPEETICNTLIPGDKVGLRASYWSSKGSNDPAVPETLTYKLASKLSVITEIHIHPFQAFFQFGFPIYSAKAVRFLMGHPRKEAESGDCDEFVWTRVSPDFPMAQDNKLQKFKLPEPVLCLGGILQVQLLGRVQRQEMDGLYYICICNVQVLGRPLSSDFDVEILDQTGKCAVKYCPESHSLSKNCCPRGESSSSGSPSQLQRLSAGIRGWEQMILNTLLGAGAVVVDDVDDDDDGIINDDDDIDQLD